MAVTLVEARRVLRQSDVFLIHFSTVMQTMGEGYPHDLKYVIAHATTYRPACATIAPTDGASRYPGDVGVILDPISDKSILIAHNGDAGSGMTEPGVEGFGQGPSLDDCENSIRTPGDRYNEWRIQDYRVQGIFVASWRRLKVPRFVDLTMLYLAAGISRESIPTTRERGEVWVELPQVMADFPGQRFFSVRDGAFVEFCAGKSPAPVLSDSIYSSGGATTLSPSRL